MYTLLIVGSMTVLGNYLSIHDCEAAAKIRNLQNSPKAICVPYKYIQQPTQQEGK